jgi:hypothetical protein
MHFDPWVSAPRRRPLGAFAAAFAGVFLLGAVVIGVEFLELNRQPAEAQTAVSSTAAQSPASDRYALEAKFREARDRTADARRQADAAEVALFQFLNGRFVDSAEQANADPRPEPSPAPIAPTIRPNPEWVETNRELSAMRQRRSELLVNLTPAHPSVQALDGQIASLQDQLASIPAELPVDPSEIASTPPVDHDFAAPPVAESRPAVNAPSAEMQQDYRNLLIAAGKARENYQTALEAENTEWAEFRNGGSSSLALDRAGTVDLRPSDAVPQSLASDDRPFPIGAIAVLTLLSLFAGITASRGMSNPTPTFASEAEIEATLGLPVLGRIGRDDESRPANAA